MHLHAAREGMCATQPESCFRGSYITFGLAAMERAGLNAFAFNTERLFLFLSLCLPGITRAFGWKRCICADVQIHPQCYALNCTRCTVLFLPVHFVPVGVVFYSLASLRLHFLFVCANIELNIYIPRRYNFAQSFALILPLSFALLPNKQIIIHSFDSPFLSLGSVPIVTFKLSV